MIGGGEVCFHFFDRLTLVGVSRGWEFCVRGIYVWYGTTLRHYMNLLVRMMIMEWFLN